MTTPCPSNDSRQLMAPFTTPKTSAYNDNVDFDALAMQDAAFARLYSDCNRRLNFHDPATLQQLTKSLLRVDFGLELDLPDDRLCPPVPVRWNYVHWIQRLVDSTSAVSPDQIDTSNQAMKGLDIGTGASAIYPLLACSSRPKWQMYATDIDAKSLDYATTNIETNKLQNRIHLRRSTIDEPLIPLASLCESLDFVMCNPPFYSSRREMADSQALKQFPPSAICTGADVEMLTPGGDAVFVTRLVSESLLLTKKIKWYTSMLGKKQSLHAVHAALKKAGVDNLAVATLRQGRTRRWVLAWSFHDKRPAPDVLLDHVDAPISLPGTELTILVQGASRDLLAGLVARILDPLDLEYVYSTCGKSGMGYARGNVWSRSARRRSPVKSPDKPVALGFVVAVHEGAVSVRWFQGTDRVLFESLCGMLRRGLRYLAAQEH